MQLSLNTSKSTLTVNKNGLFHRFTNATYEPQCVLGLLNFEFEIRTVFCLHYLFYTLSNL